jgi:hypothetical protein
LLRRTQPHKKGDPATGITESEIASIVLTERGRLDIICRSVTVYYLKRIRGRCPDIADMSFEELVEAKIELSVFRLPDATAS